MNKIRSSSTRRPHFISDKLSPFGWLHSFKVLAPTMGSYPDQAEKDIQPGSFRLGGMLMIITLTINILTRRRLLFSGNFFCQKSYSSYLAQWESQLS